MKSIPLRRSRWLVLLVISLVAGVGLAQRWDDVKLRLTGLSGYASLDNNPLLPSQSADLKATNTAQSRIVLTDLLSGGPPKDGIPALSQPAFDTPAQSPFADDALVLGLVINGQAKAYPYGILNWHEIVNDTVGGVPVAVTYCPLCETGIVFERRVGGVETTFGVSGKLFQSCLVMYDRFSDSLWSQPWGLGVVGAQTNHGLTRRPAVRTTLGAWKKVYPHTTVLSLKTGFERDYLRYPYGTYYDDESLIFPVRHADRVKGSLKAIESYYWHANGAVPLNQFSGLAVHFSWQQVRQAGHLAQVVDGHTIEARWHPTLQAVQLFENDQELASSAAFAFVYPAFFE